MMPKVTPYPRMNLAAIVRDVISSHTAIRAGIAVHAEKERQRRGEAMIRRAANLHLKTSVKPAIRGH